jgi:hypothetical protein
MRFIYDGSYFGFSYVCIYFRLYLQFSRNLSKLSNDDDKKVAYKYIFAKLAVISTLANELKVKNESTTTNTGK